MNRAIDGQTLLLLRTVPEARSKISTTMNTDRCTHLFEIKTQANQCFAP